MITGRSNDGFVDQEYIEYAVPGNGRCLGGGRPFTIYWEFKCNGAPPENVISWDTEGSYSEQAHVSRGAGEKLKKKKKG